MVVIVGGQTKEGNMTAITDTVELYDVASNKLSQGERWQMVENEARKALTLIIK